MRGIQLSSPTPTTGGSSDSTASGRTPRVSVASSRFRRMPRVAPPQTLESFQASSNARPGSEPGSCRRATAACPTSRLRLLGGLERAAAANTARRRNSVCSSSGADRATTRSSFAGSADAPEGHVRHREQHKTPLEPPRNSPATATSRVRPRARARAGARRAGDRSRHRAVPSKSGFTPRPRDEEVDYLLRRRTSAWGIFPARTKPEATPFVTRTARFGTRPTEARRLVRSIVACWRISSRRSIRLSAMCEWRSSFVPRTWPTLWRRATRDREATRAELPPHASRIAGAQNAPAACAASRVFPVLFQGPVKVTSAPRPAQGDRSHSRDRLHVPENSVPGIEQLRLVQHLEQQERVRAVPSRRSWCGSVAAER